MPSRNKGGIIYYTLIEFLADEKWHSYDEALRVGAQACPPGLAIRTAEKQREQAWLREHPGQPVAARVKNHNTDYLIRVGGRAAALKVIMGPAFERDKEKGLVRLNPRRKYVVNQTGRHLLHEYRPKPPPLTEEQKAEARRERARKAYRTRLQARGIDPDTPRVKELILRARQEWAALSEEEKAEARSERARKAAATRRLNRQQKETHGQIPSPGGRRGREEHPDDRETPGDRSGGPAQGDPRSDE